MIRTLLLFLFSWLSAAIMAIAVMWPAGTTDLPVVWAWAISFGVLTFIAFMVIDPDLIKERRKPGPGGKDFFLLIIARPLLIPHLIIAGLDIGRYHWSDTIPLWAQIVALMVALAGFGLAVWSMAVNKFFSAVIRHQTDRGHVVIDRGPYSIVRHPGYAGIIPAVMANGMALGSWVSVIPMAVFAIFMLRRTILEDRFLLEHLDGYREYAARVRYRLIPGLW